MECATADCNVLSYIRVRNVSHRHKGGHGHGIRYLEIQNHNTSTMNTAKMNDWADGLIMASGGQRPSGVDTLAITATSVASGTSPRYHISSGFSTTSRGNCLIFTHLLFVLPEFISRTVSQSEQPDLSLDIFKH